MAKKIGRWWHSFSFILGLWVGESKPRLAQARLPPCITAGVCERRLLPVCDQYPTSTVSVVRRSSDAPI